MSDTPLDPDLQPLAEAAQSATPLTSQPAAQARQASANAPTLTAPAPEPAQVTDLSVGTIGVRLYAPTSTPAQHALMYLHGGGWVVGDLDTSDAFCREIAVGAPCLVVSVDYRLAPEHPFPAAYEDTLEIWRWCRGTGAGGAADPDAAWAIGGESAGGNLAAAAARALHGTEDEPAFQALCYPVLDHDLGRESYAEQESGFPVPAAAMAWFWDHYAPADVQRDDPRLSPLRGLDPRRTLPTLLAIAGHDPLRDEAEEFASRLATSGTPATVLRFADLPHYFTRFTGVSDRARRATAEVVEQIAARFATLP